LTPPYLPFFNLYGFQDNYFPFQHLSAIFPIFIKTFRQRKPLFLHLNNQNPTNNLNVEEPELIIRCKNAERKAEIYAHTGALSDE
jgi:hypothetical protein